MVEDKEVTPGQHRPIIVLVSMGNLTINGKILFVNLLRKAVLLSVTEWLWPLEAMQIEPSLKSFSGTSHQLCFAKNASQLHEFFQRVTMSVTMRSNSTDPNELPEDSVLKLDGTIAKASPVSQGGTMIPMIGSD